MNEQELHTSLAIQDTFDLSSMPVQDSTIASIKPAQKNNYRPLNNSPKKEKNFHIVKEKETLYRIAIDYGITVKHIHQLNPSLKKKNTIKAGQKIRVR